MSDSSREELVTPQEIQHNSASELDTKDEEETLTKSDENEKEDKTKEIKISIETKNSSDKAVVNGESQETLASPEKSESEKSQINNQDDYAEHITYTATGEAIYTDPKTNLKYKWSSEENNWVAIMGKSSEQSSHNAYENEHYKWCAETKKWILKPHLTQGLTTTTTEQSATETDHYKWDAAKGKWIPKVRTDGESHVEHMPPSNYDIDENGQRTYTDKDGVTFFWDTEKNAWFPKIDDDFMARYQMSYGFNNDSSDIKEDEKPAERKVDDDDVKNSLNSQMKSEEDEFNVMSEQETNVANKEKAAQTQAKWFDLDPAHNTKVYVSNLPLDITVDEFVELMGKCGLVMRDPQTQKYKVKLYTEADGQIKGDGLCDYIKVESVELALKILDDYYYRGNKIRVQRAQFQMRGEYNPSLKPKRKKKDKEKLLKMKEKLFDWRPEKMRGERTKNEKIVIIKNLFTPEIFEKEIQLLLEYQNDLREECSKCGTVRKVIIYDRHPEGVAQINMATPEEADLVIQMMQGRFFGKRQLTADHWDGKTKYKTIESEQEVAERLNNWDEFLVNDEAENAKKPEAALLSTENPLKQLADDSQEDDCSSAKKPKVSD